MLDFPSSPTVGQTYQASAATPVYRWDGVKWKLSAPPFGAGASAVLPAMDGIAAPGTANQWSRGDHKHAYDTRYVPVNSPTFTGTLTAPSFTFAGDMTVSGKFISTADGHQLGNHIGVTSLDWNNITPAETNIIFYDYGSNNWAGIGTDRSGFFFVRTGGGGSNNVSGMVANLSNVEFTGVLYAPTPPNGTNSNMVATTAYVTANQPVGGPYLPLSGGTMTGALTVSYGHVMPYRNGATGVCYVSNGDVYVYYDGTNYSLGNGGALHTLAGRIWGSSDWSRPVTSARIGPLAADQWLRAGDAYSSPPAPLTESYGGAVVTGCSGATMNLDGITFGNYFRFRYNQIYVEGTWYTAGYV